MTIRRSHKVLAVLAGIVALATSISAVAASDGDRPAPDAPAAERDTDAQIARIVAAYVAPHELVIEPADLLVGDAAAEAAEADGAEVLDFYVRDHPDRRTALPVATDVRVTVVDCRASCVEGAPGDYDTLTRTVDPSRLHRLTVRDGMVTAIDEVYLP